MLEEKTKEVRKTAIFTFFAEQIAIQGVYTKMFHKFNSSLRMETFLATIKPHSMKILTNVRGRVAKYGPTLDSRSKRFVRNLINVGTVSILQGALEERAKE